MKPSGPHLALGAGALLTGRGLAGTGADPKPAASGPTTPAGHSHSHTRHELPAGDHDRHGTLNPAGLVAGPASTG